LVSLAAFRAVTMAATSAALRSLALVCASSAFAASSGAPLTPLPEAQIAARAEAALMGGFLADAAAMPLHWIYDVGTIKRLVGAGEPEFYPTPSCPFYKYPSGANTPYGQQYLAYLTVGAASGGFDPSAIEAAYAALYKSAPTYWYRDASTKEFLANEAAGQHWPSCGGNDDQADGIVHSLPVVALLGGRNTSAMLAAAEPVVRVTQNTDRGVAFALAAARVLEYVIAYNLSGADLLTRVIADLRDPARASPFAEDSGLADGLQNALDKLSEDNMDFVLSVGQACDYPFNLWTGSHLIAQLGASPADYLSGVRQTILAGGDSGSRSFFVGAAQAARAGSLAALPAGWASKTTAYATAAPLAHAIVAARSRRV